MKNFKTFKADYEEIPATAVGIDLYVKKDSTKQKKFKILTKEELVKTFKLTQSN